MYTCEMRHVADLDHHEPESITTNVVIIVVIIVIIITTCMRVRCDMLLT